MTCMHNHLIHSFHITKIQSHTVSPIGPIGPDGPSEPGNPGKPIEPLVPYKILHSENYNAMFILHFKSLRKT